MQQRILWIFSFISFLVVLWWKPTAPIKIFLVSLGVMLLGFAYQQTKPVSERFFKLDESFVLLDETGEEKPRDGFTLLYGTNTSLTEVRDYFRALVKKGSWLERLVEFMPGGDLFSSRSLYEYGSVEEGGVLTEIQYGQGDSVTINMNSPAGWKKAAGFKTSVYMQYSLQETAALVRYYALVLPLLIG